MTKIIVLYLLIEAQWMVDSASNSEYNKLSYFNCFLYGLISSKTFVQGKGAKSINIEIFVNFLY